MRDIQNQADHRQIAIDKVGVCDLQYPIVVLDQKNQSQSTIACLSMSVSLPHEFKGTHMSRFIETLNAHRGEVTMRTLPKILGELKNRLASESAHIEAAFPYFLERIAPVSGAVGLMDYQCKFVGEANDAKSDFILSVCVPVTSLCPCSKAISDYGAHNQRGEITIEVRSRATDTGAPVLVWIEELIEVAESSASAPVYALLKREDERYVTMQAYDNPVFVEDIVRNVAAKLQADERLIWFRVYALNHESIHNHGAFAEIEWSKPSEN
jgi:GTP cyclohydrolase I